MLTLLLDSKEQDIIYMLYGKNNERSRFTLS